MEAQLFAGEFLYLFFDVGVRKKTLSCREPDNRGGRAGFGDFWCYVINGSIMGTLIYRTMGSLFIPSPPLGESVRVGGI